MTLDAVLAAAESGSAVDRLLHPFEFFAPSYLATVLMAALCAWLGVYITLKRIVFVGAALAEVAAAGIAFAFLLLTTETVAAWAAVSAGRDHALKLGAAVGFSLAGVAAFAAPFTQRRISREALVGIGFAVAGALSMLLVAKSAHGLEELKNILSGNVLFVDDAQLVTIAVTASAIGLVHAAFFKEFVFASFDPVMARTLGLPARRLDLVLHLTFGLAIAVALRTGGVLLVFGYLVLPAAGALLLGSRLGPVFAHAVAQALGASALGLYAADRYDLPPGPSTVAALAAFVAASFAVRDRPAPRRALVVLEGALAAVALGLAAFALAVHLREDHRPRPHPAHAHGEAPHEHAPGGPPHVPLPTARLTPEVRALVLALDSPDEGERERALAALAARKDPDIAPTLIEALEGASPTRRVHVAQALLALGNARGVEVLIAVLRSDAPPFDRYEALTVLARLSGSDFGYDPDRDAAGNAAALAKFDDWWRHERARFRPPR